MADGNEKYNGDEITDPKFRLLLRDELPTFDEGYLTFDGVRYKRLALSEVFKTKLNSPWFFILDHGGRPTHEHFWTESQATNFIEKMSREVSQQLLFGGTD
jgi:hypothetical protein